MRKLNEIATDLRGVLTEYFRTVRISAVQTSEQLLKEIKAINPEKLPGVIIIFDNLNFEGMAMTNTGRVTLVLIDQFRSGSDERALSLFQAGSSLMTLFPADGKEINGVYYYPLDCVAASPDSQYAALAIGLEVKQGSV
ncbi:MAG: hypothetical protein IJH79_15350 [Lentisphaeria bacterium]|nr:hypothetical protein [Lentisphaeria bacterium]